MEYSNITLLILNLKEVDRDSSVTLKMLNASVYSTTDTLSYPKIEKWTKKILKLESDSEDLYKTWEKMSKLDPNEAKDLTRRLEMVLCVNVDQALEGAMLLEKISYSDIWSDAERVKILVSLFNHSFYDLCFPALAKILENLTESRWILEACRFLYLSNDTTFRAQVKQKLITLLENPNVSSEQKYEIVWEYTNPYYLQTVFNAKRMVCDQDLEFVYDLFHQAFMLCDIREKILAAQYLLDHITVDHPRRKKFEDTLLRLGQSETLTEDVRADALDVLLRSGKIYNKEARLALAELGYIMTVTDTTTAGGFGKRKTKRIKTFANNSQNIHTIAVDTTTSYVEKLLDTQTLVEPDPITVMKRITESIAVLGDKLDKTKITKALRRIKLDTSTLTKYNVTLAEILVYVYNRILTFKASEVPDDSGSQNPDNPPNPQTPQNPQNPQSTLFRRLLEELVDMDDTCTSGHYVRLVNVLSGFDQTVSISWEDQIRNNVMGRMQKRIKESEHSEDLLLGIIDLEDPKVKEIYEKVMPDIWKEVEAEIREEFLESKFVSASDYEKIMASIRSEWFKS